MMKIILLALLQHTLSINVREDKPGFTVDFKSLSEAQKKLELKSFYDDVSKYLKERSDPFCKNQSAAAGFDWATFSSGGWHMQYHQPTFYEIGTASKCSKIDFTDKAGLGNDYTFEFFAQTYSQTMQQSSSWLGCGLVESPGNLKIGTCDAAPDNVNFIVIHHEEGDDEFIVTVGGNPVIPIMQTDGSMKCMHEQISPQNAMGGLFVFTRNSGTMSDAAVDRAKKVVSDNGMIWDGVMMPTAQTDCDYLSPSAGNTIGPLDVNPDPTANSADPEKVVEEIVSDLEGIANVEEADRVVGRIESDLEGIANGQVPEEPERVVGRIESEIDGILEGEKDDRLKLKLTKKKLTKNII
jgi:hypothetical protein